MSRAEAQAKASGEHIDNFLAPPSEEEQRLMQQAGSAATGGGGEALMQCPICGRTFNRNAGERHIPKCRDIVNKPTRLIRGSGRGIGAISGSPPKSSLGDRGDKASATSNRDSNRDNKDRDASRGGFISSHDSGMAVFESARISSHQRTHPSPSTHTSHLNTRPYGLSLTEAPPGRGGSSSSSGRQRPQVVMGTTGSTRTGSSDSSGGVRAGRQRLDMATANGRKLQSLMSAKEEMSAAVTSASVRTGGRFGRK